MLKLGCRHSGGELLGQSAEDLGLEEPGEEVEALQGSAEARGAQESLEEGHEEVLRGVRMHLRIRRELRGHRSYECGTRCIRVRSKSGAFQLVFCNACWKRGRALHFEALWGRGCGERSL